MILYSSSSILEEEVLPTVLHFKGTTAVGSGSIGK